MRLLKEYTVAEMDVLFPLQTATAMNTKQQQLHPQLFIAISFLNLKYFKKRTFLTERGMGYQECINEPLRNALSLIIFINFRFSFRIL